MRRFIQSHDKLTFSRLWPIGTCHSPFFTNPSSNTTFLGYVTDYPNISCSYRICTYRLISFTYKSSTFCINLDGIP
ncbi:hypothetical protein CW304_14365 [Bacillus sp. UFRGS-B20]|nr:hypothetical protein CW304_14365 [Bacillus sp. UFRGS-B20]